MKKKNTYNFVSFVGANEFTSLIQLIFQELANLRQSGIYNVNLTVPYITDLVCCTHCHGFFNHKCLHIFGKQTEYIF